MPTPGGRSAIPSRKGTTEETFATTHTLNRDEQIERLGRESFDLAVIGGGINGAAVARDAAMRGLKVALFDKGDFAGATSSSSSKLIHGGFRYLPQGQFRLVYAALRERERLHRVTAPHLVRPIRFLFPLYRGRGFHPFVMALGMTLYDLFARMPCAERHRRLDSAGVRAIEPGLNVHGLRGGSLYYDACADDARLTLENVLDAAAHGSVVANYFGIVGFSRSAGKIAAAGMREMVGGRTFELRARVFVNAAGPWVDDVRRLDDPGCPPSVRLTKGAHLVFSRQALPVCEALVLCDSADRIVFVMPYDRYVLVGTTDTDFDGDREHVRADRADVEYLLGVLSGNLPDTKLEPGDVVSSFAGLRALVQGNGQSPSALPREETILQSRSGLISVAGGKLTTHREIAQQVVDRVMAELSRPKGKCLTLATPLIGARPCGSGSSALQAVSSEVRSILIGRYGTRAAIPAQLIVERPELAEPVASGCPILGAEVIYAARNELARTVADFIVRRTAASWRYPIEAIAAAPKVVNLMGKECGWDRARKEAELGSFRMAIARAKAAA
jgi:glycerol-3-phosphate dehydrogenase